MNVTLTSLLPTLRSIILPKNIGADICAVSLFVANLFLGHHGVHGAPFCRHRLATNLFLFHYPRYGNVAGSLHDVGDFLRHRVLRTPAFKLAAVSASSAGDDHAFRNSVPLRGNRPSPVAACLLYGTFRGRVCADFPFDFPACGTRRDWSLLRLFDCLFPAAAGRFPCCF